MPRDHVFSGCLGRYQRCIPSVGARSGASHLHFTSARDRAEAIPLRARSGSLGVLILAFSRASFALDAATEPIRIEYRADQGARCPSAREFAGQVFARTGRARPASESEPARTFIVELRREGARVRGTLVVDETGGPSMARQVTGSECDHVASVLALATALAIDPRAELQPHENLEPVRPSPPSEAPPKAPEMPHKGGDDGWSARASIGVAVAFGFAPHPSLGPTAMLALRRDRAPVLEEVGLGFTFRTGAAELVRGARADFHFYVARPTLCFRGIEIAGPLHVAPCLVFEAGAVTGVGSDLPIASRATRFWAAAEVLLRLEYPLPAGFFVNLEGGGVLPLTRYRFVFRNPDTPVHEVPVVTAEVALRVGASF